MNVWNRLGDLAKGTIDWVGDVGLAAGAAPKFIWDIGTAPFNDRKEFNGFFNTLQQASTDFVKNVARPVGGVLSAIDKTNQNLIRQPLSAAMLYAQGDGLGLDDWKKAWEAKDEISVGQAALGLASKTSILRLLPDELTPKVLDNDFDIYDEKQRQAAFKDSVYGRVLSGAGDVAVQLFGDVTLVGGKITKAAKVADTAFEAVQGIRAAKNPLLADLNPTAQKYAKLADDFAANDAIWAANHPWVKKSNNQASSSYLLGQASNRDEALNTMLALLGDNTGAKALDELKRPDLAEPLRIANGELSRSQLKVLLREEEKLATSAESGMLPLNLRTPEEILADREYIKAWATHDKYVDKLFELSDEAPMRAGVNKYGQVIGKELATARSVPFHQQPVGNAKIEMYQPTTFHKLYSKISWLQGERASGMVNLNEGDSIREITAITTRLVQLSKSGAAITRPFNTGSFTFEDAAKVVRDYSAAGSPEARGAIVNALEQRGYNVLAAKHGIDAETAQKLFDYHVQTRTGKMREIKEEGFLWDAETETMLKVPLLESQTANFLPVADFDTIDKVIKANSSRIRAIAFNGVQLAEYTSDLWKASVLLRLGYPVRNAIDSQLRILATVGAMASLRHFKDGSRNLVRNTADSHIGSRLVDRFQRVEKLNYKQIKNETQTLGREIATHEKDAMKYQELLKTNPENAEIIGKLATTTNLIRAKSVAYDANNRTLTSLEQKLSSGQKQTIAQGELKVSSVMKDADGVEYTVYDAFGSPNGNLYRELNSSDRSFNALLEDYSQLYGANVASKGRGAVRPTDPNYYTDWARSINEEFSNSAVARRLMADEDPQDIARWVEDNQALRARLGISRDEALEYVYRVQTFVDNYVPRGTGIREKVLGATPSGPVQQVTPEFLREAIKNPDELPVIHGNLVDENINMRSRQVIKGVRNELFRYIGTMPENAWARHPLFVDLYQKSIKDRIATAEQLKGGTFTRAEFDEIQYGLEKAARADALKGVKEILYNIERRSNAAHMLRFVSPFFSAQENAIKTWLKIASDNPVIINRASLAWTAPNRMGIATDENGNQVPRDKALQATDTMWFEVPGGLKKLPIIGKGLSSLDKIGITKQSLDVAFQGNPFGVSLGPLTAIPASYVMKAKPELAQVVGFLFPYGPDTSIKSILPTYIRRQWEKMEGMNSSDYARTYQLIYLTEQHKARDEQRPYLTEKEIKAKVDAYYNMRTAANLILPFAPKFNSPYKYYIDKWHEYSQTYGIEADSKFLQDYPDFFEFSASLSKNTTGSGSSLDDVANAKRYSSLISEVFGDNPALVGAITRTANSAKFNPTAYWWQSETAITPGSAEKFRDKASVTESIAKNESRQGWAVYRRASAIIDARLQERGLTSLEQAGAEDLKAAKEAVVRSLATNKDPVTGKSNGQPSAWYQDYRDVDGLKSAKNVNGLRKIISNEKFMADNGSDPTWRSVAVYLQIRDSIATSLRGRASGSITAKSNADLKLAMDYYINQLKLGDVEFADIYERFLSQDKVYDQYLDSGI
jgi:hypothetical protein